MNWQQVGTIAATFAPTIGKIVGGFIPIPGGALIAEGVGTLIAKQFGVPATPDAVGNAIQSNPNEVVIAKLNAAAEEAKAKWPAVAEIYKAEAERDAKVTESVNATMRVEVVPENRHWFYTGWRPACGWVLVLFSVIFGVLLSWATIQAVGGDAEPLRVMTEAWPIYLAYFGTLAAMVGVYVVARSKDKAAAAENAVPVAATKPTQAKPVVTKR